MSEDTVVGPLGVPGREVMLGDGKKYVIAALTFGPAKRLKSVMEAKDRTPETIMDGLTEALRNSLARNYPEVTAQAVEENLLGYDNKDEVQRTLLAQTYPKPKDAQPGEEQPQPKASPSTGMDSTST